ncbi:Retrovirus-related Pol polyprotein from transposon TNT 1-94 [Vitis vinifera]|uniref:Retrovirus-related Pol polyprotein from transposon TNT 1-94 n=1 Tax=Vitis vinifera TaxID=29760 RepID=A0A438GN85_VITVI|nr:Retrovirus-related Pol polyprotein from transposon TNT 1-94 [Vitis vinifera]
MYLGVPCEAILEKHKIDLIDYDEAMSDADAHIWQRACGGCKWAYKRNKGVDGRVETYKARLVVKGYSQKLGFKYEDNLLVAMLKFIRILLSIATHLDYEIWQMDVKTTFLNDNLDESIYMM